MDGNRRPEVDLAAVEGILDEVLCAGSGATARLGSDGLIPLLQRIQDAYGYLPTPALARASERTGIPSSRIYGVATFYAQFHLEPHGRHAIRCCRGTACHVRGGKNIISTVKSSLGLEEGQTSPDMAFSFETVACLGACAIAPVMVVDSAYHGKMTPRRSEQILETLRKPQTP